MFFYLFVFQWSTIMAAENLLAGIVIKFNIFSSFVKLIKNELNKMLKLKAFPLKCIRFFISNDP